MSDPTDLSDFSSIEEIEIENVWIAIPDGTRLAARLLAAKTGARKRADDA